MSHDMYDYSDEIAQEEFIRDNLKGISEDGVRGYLGTYGDAVDKRIASSLTQAEQLKDAGWLQASVAMSVTAIELTVRFLLIRPLIQAAFLSPWIFLTQACSRARTSRLDTQAALPSKTPFNPARLCNPRNVAPKVPFE